MKRTSALLGALSAALLLTATLPATTATAAKPPVKAVFGGIVDDQHPALPIGSRLPATLPATLTTARTADVPVPPTLTKAREEAAKSEITRPLTPPSGTVALAGPVPHSTPFVTVKWCRENTDTDGNASMAMDRFNWCAGRDSVIYYIDEEGQVQGNTTFRMTTAGRGDKGSRKTFFTSEFYNFVDSGVVLPAALVRLELSYSTSGYSDTDGSNPACGVVGNSPTTVAAWRSGSTAVFEINSNAADGYTPDKISRCTVNQQGRSDLNLGWVTLHSTNVRADSASYLGVAGATIFSDKYAALWDYTRSDPAVNEVAQHIYDAQTNPESTYPPKVGKSIPGRIGSGRPLHYAANVVWDVENYQRRKDNTTAKNNACKALSPSGTPVGKECDEYPFASTMEGAGLGDGNFSVRYVTSSDNNTAGQWLATWYKDERVINREGFYPIIGG
ncbi:NucA/NucB deoxyribonuclease domain-containing protein [Streptomyces sp. NBC_01244]|uniref:NucA/NucB deoxyribonuclease domain-containing protein n=1 Tax=Streptomyces sp. NBC_01244 TaxID=2903797 RepID=UPI002E1410FB|nr:NucA/NucB deoxyribonuclease domain-containing protein [Streptomyces sp. NBC_01244]